MGLSRIIRAMLACGLAATAEIPRPDDAPKPRTPERSAAAFRLPEGFRMEVAAAEPLIASPTSVCWDERGRMFVGELHGYNLAGELDVEALNRTGRLDTEVRRVQADERFKKAAEPGTYGVVKLLHDDDGDGRMDRATVWATNLPPVYGLVPARGGVIATCAPDIVFLADRDGDGTPEVREKLFTGFPTGELERGVNAPQWGPDGWIYVGRGWGGGKITGAHLAAPVDLPGSDFRIRADGTAIEPVTGGTHTFGFAMTAAGDRFTVTTTVPGIYVAPLPWRYLGRNPAAAVPTVTAETGDRRAHQISRPHPWRRKRAEDPEYFKYYNSRYGAAESEADGWFTAACGPLLYRDRALPGLHGQYFVCEPSGNLIHRALVEPEGSVLRLRRAPGEERTEFAASDDGWSHPMNLTHGPDGRIWVVDYYREIIEDYSAIPRHLQQQYGVYAGHDRGRVYRLTHRDAPAPPPADMGLLDAGALARECVSPLLWRRLTAQRLITERREISVVPALRASLAADGADPEGVIVALRTLDALEALRPDDAARGLRHAAPAARVHALQLGDRWFARDEGHDLLDAALEASKSERDARVRVQFALSLGESRDSRAFAALARMAREKPAPRWMHAAILSGLHGRAADMLSEMLRTPDAPADFVASLARSIAAGGDPAELAHVLKLLGFVPAPTRVAVLEALAKGRADVPRRPLPDASARAALEGLAKDDVAAAALAAKALADAYGAPDGDETTASGATSNAADTLDEATYRKFAAALAAGRDPERGHAVYLRACSPCHRIGDEGHEVGPDLLGQAGMAEESLLRDILAPGERIRPGYEATEVRLRDGTVVAGLLKDDGATSLTLAQAGGLGRVLLRRDLAEVRRVPVSIMPSFAEALAPAEAADLLAWIRGVLKTPAGPKPAR